MPAVEITHVTLDGLDFIAEHIREADRLEVEAASGLTPREALLKSVEMSEMAFMAVNAMSFPVCIFGSTPAYDEPHIAIPWMLGTDNTYKIGRDLKVIGKRFFDEVRVSRPHLVNYVDARNHRSIRYLRSMGFTIHDPVPWGAQGLPFHRFEMTPDV